MKQKKTLLIVILAFALVLAVAYPLYNSLSQEEAPDQLVAFPPKGNSSANQSIVPRPNQQEGTQPNRPAETEPGKLVETQPTEPPETEPSKPAETQPTEPPHTEPGKPAETQPTEPPQTEPSKPAETQPTEPPETEPSKPVETQPAEPPETEPSKPVETQPTEPPETEPSKPAETRPTEPPQTEPSKPVETQPTAPPETQPTNPPVEIEYDFTAYDGNGKAVKLSDYVGKPIVLNFWASWCGPCKSEMPEFQEVYEEMGDKVQFLMVNATVSEGSIEDAKTYIRKSGYTFPVLFDTHGEGLYVYGVDGFPTTFFLDKDGNPIVYAVGAISKQTLLQGIEMIQ